MKALISRASLGVYSEEPPVPGARKEEVVQVDLRTVSASEHLRNTHHWYESGTNHRLIDGCIARDFTDERWVIEIDDLVGFIKEHGSCIVSVDPNGMLDIKIYDDYVE